MDQLGHRPGRRPRTNGPTVGAKRSRTHKPEGRIEVL
nr:MAG TPA: hypothetical protein [Caudoviricetes sp.]